ARLGLRRAVVLEELAIAAALDRALGELARRRGANRVIGEVVDDLEKRGEALARGGGDVTGFDGAGDDAAHRIEQREVLALRDGDDAVDRRVADPARRRVDHANEIDVALRVGGEAEVGEEVLDLGALEEAQATDDAVGNARLT